MSKIFQNVQVRYNLLIEIDWRKIRLERVGKSLLQGIQANYKASKK